MKKHILSAILLLIFSACYAQVETPVYFSDIWSGDESGQYDEKFMIINNNNDYIEMWNSIKAPYKPESPDPVDFSKEVVVAYFAGDQTNGTEVEKVVKKGKDILITFSRISLDRNCYNAKLLVTPYTILKFQKQEGCAIRYDTEVKIVSCD